MPKISATTSSKLNIFVAEYKGILSSHGLIMFCLKCNVKANGEKRFTVIQHLSTEKDKRTVERTNFSCNFKISFFYQDMCNTMVSADIYF